MTHQTLQVLLPRPVAPPRGAQWAGAGAALLFEAARWARNALQRATADEPPESMSDLLSLARSVEKDMPKLALELRAIAMHRPRAQG